MKNIKHPLSLILLVLILLSCDNTLSTIPDDRTEIDSPDKVKELLTGAYPESLYAPFLEPRTDNAEDKGLETTLHRYNTEAYFWRDVFDDSRQYPTHYWNHVFSAIAQSNQALESIEDLGGGEEYDKFVGEALLTRAYGYFMLANIWCKAYDPSTADTDLGMPYLKVPENTLINFYERGTLSETYDNIKEDLERGLELVSNDFDKPEYHFNKHAAYAFATRFYLYTGDWDKVIEYGEKVVNGNDELRDWTNAYSSLTYDEIKERFTGTLDPTNLLIVSASSTFARDFTSSRYQLSVSLRNRLFSANNPVGKSWSYRVFGTDTHLNIPNYLEYFRYTNLAAGTGFPFANGILFSRDEVILNLAEAYAMKGQYDMAAEKINDFLSVKTSGYVVGQDELSVADIQSYYQVDEDRYTPFYNIAPDALPFVNGIAELKRREFYNMGLRWFDIKRFHMEVVHKDIRGNTYTLTKDDPRRELQIPNEAVAFGLEENPR